MTLRDGMVCEHCVIEGKTLSMMGWITVLQCEKGFRNSDKDCIMGFVDPCDYYPSCFTDRLRSKDGKSHFRYNRIKRSEMRKSENCIKDEKEERERQLRKANALRDKAMQLMDEARDLERLHQ